MNTALRHSRPNCLAITIFMSCIMGCTIGDLPNPPSTEALARYREHSTASDPEELSLMYSNLPGPGQELCRVIKHQLIHPFDLPKFENELGRKFRFEDLEFPDVHSMLTGLKGRGGPELSMARGPSERLVVACWHHALLLTSILRNQGVPIRMRAGFARYIGRDSGLHVGHVICEVWDEGRNRWTLIDPDREKLHFKRREFAFGFEAWRALRGGSAVSGYRSAHYEGAAAIVHLLILDMKAVLREERPYWCNPPMVNTAKKGLNALDADHIKLLDRVASCMKNLDASLGELEVLRSSEVFQTEIDSSEEIRQHLPD